MTWLVLAVMMVGLPLLALLGDLARHDLERTLAAADAALGEAEREPASPAAEGRGRGTGGLAARGRGGPALPGRDAGKRS